MSSGHGRATYYRPRSGNIGYRSGNISFVASGLSRPTKQNIVLDFASETAIVNALDNFQLADIDGEDIHSRKKGDIEDVETRPSMAQSNACSATRHVNNEED
jgi:hypothetical protein